MIFAWVVPIKSKETTSVASLPCTAQSCPGYIDRAWKPPVKRPSLALETSNRLCYPLVNVYITMERSTMFNDV